MPSFEDPPTGDIASVARETIDPRDRDRAGATITFGPFRLFPGQRLLTKDGAEVAIGSRAFDILMLLIERANEIISKKDLMARVWPDTAVGEGSLRFHMTSLRTALGDGEDGARYVRTVVGRGYCFVAPIVLSKAPTGPVEGAVRPVFSLPPRLHRMIGRDLDVETIVRDILAQRFVSVVGPPGVGKTTVVVAAAHELAPTFPDGVLFVDLGALESADLVPGALTAAFGLTVHADDPTPSIIAFVRARRMLLILDNCEHVIQTASDLVERIFHGAPDAHLLITSREPLRVEGENVNRLGTLAAPPDDVDLETEDLAAYPAARLLIERVLAAGGHVDLAAGDGRFVGAISRRLDGVALAIELAAARVASHGLNQVMALLDERLSLAWPGRRTALPRQQTLLATLDWSYALLSDAERELLAWLAVFVGPFSFAAARAVALACGMDESSAVQAVESLVTKSLISIDGVDRGHGYRLLEITRAYAHEKLAQQPAKVRAVAALGHARYYCDFLAAVWAGEAPSSPSGRSAAVRQLGNVRAALAWGFGPEGDLCTGIELAARAARLFLEVSLLTECRTWCERAVRRMAQDGPAPECEMELRAVLGLCLMFTQGNSDAARASLGRALAIAEDLGDAPSQLRIIAILHIYHERIGDFAGALHWAERGKIVSEDIMAPVEVGAAYSLLAISHHLLGDQPLGTRYAQDGLHVSPPSIRSRTVYFGFDHRNRAGICLARTLVLQGALDRGRAAAEAAISEAEALDHPVTHCIALSWAITVYFWTKDADQAERCINRFITLAEVNALGPYLAVGLGFKGELAVQRGNSNSGVAALQECLGRLHVARYELLTTTFNAALAEGLIAAQRLDEALSLLDESLLLIERQGDLYVMPELLRMKASALLQRDRRAAPEVRALLLQAVETAARHGALLWELRAAMDLAALEDAGAEDLDRLDVVLGRFKEGFDTADLIKARALLNDGAKARNR